MFILHEEPQIKGPDLDSVTGIGHMALWLRDSSRVSIFGGFPGGNHRRWDSVLGAQGGPNPYHSLSTPSAVHRALHTQHLY